MRGVAIRILAVCLWASAVQAQPVADTATLSQIESDIAQLRAQIDGLRQELATADPQVTGVVNPGPLIDRTVAVEQELQRLTSQVEALRFRIDQVVADATNRIGDLDFRLTELEGGSIASIEPVAPLGEAPVPAPGAQGAGTEGGATQGRSTEIEAAPRPRPRPGDVGTPAPGPQSVEADPPERRPVDPVPVPVPVPQQPTGEGTDFDAALAAYREGRYPEAAQMFADFQSRNPGSPRAAEAAYWRGEALAATGDWSTAARSYLDSYSGAPEGAKAPDALYRLGVALARLGRTDEACLTLGEVSSRFPSAPQSLILQVDAERRALTCS